MIPASLYQPLYLLIILYLSLRVLQTYQFNVIQDLQRGGIVQRRGARLFIILMIFFIGFRPIDSNYFVDMYNYRFVYNALLSGDYSHVSFDNYLWDPIFILFPYYRIPIEFLFLFAAFIYFGGIYVASKKIFPRDSLLAVLVYLAALSTFAYGTNGVKAGSAASLFLVAIAYKNKLMIAVPFLFLSLGFHHAMALPIGAFISAYFFKKRKWYLYFWILCFLMAAFHITFFMNILSGYTDEHGAEYLQGGAEDPAAMVSGFRPDFILYSAVPIFLGNYIINKYNIKSTFYDFIWNCYTLTNSVFLLCTYGTFINRIAYLSWLMYPFVLLYPFLNVVWSKKQDIYLKKVVWGHLGFTIFMFIVILFR